MTVDTIAKPHAPAAVNLTALLEATREPRPAPLPLPDGARDALWAIPDLYGAVRTPTATEPWTADEAEIATRTLIAARAAISVAEEMARQAADAYLQHLELVAPSADPEAPRDRRGRLIRDTPVRLVIPGMDQIMSAEYRRSGNLSVEDLLRLRKAKVISRGQFKSLTRDVVVIDPEAVTSESGKDPRLGAVLAAAQSFTGTISVYLRKPAVRKTSTR